MTDKMMTSAQVREACGGVSDMCLWRWTRDAGFPQPIRVNRRRYWREADVSAWWNDRGTTAEAA